MKVKLFGLLAFVMILSLLLLVGGCGSTDNSAGSDTKEPAQDGSSQEGTAPQEPAKVIELKFSHHEPPGSNFNKKVEEWAQLVDEKTNGQVKISIFPAETLSKGKDQVSAVETGIADIGWLVIPFFPGQFPVTEVLGLPMMGVDSSRTGAVSLSKLYEQNSEMQQEWSKFKVISFFSSGYQFISSKSSIRTMDDVKGKNIRVAGWGPSEMIKAMGGSPISMPPPDMYEAMEKGVLDGFCFDWQGIQSGRLYEVADYAMETPFVVVPQALVMNKAKWESLPADLQQKLQEVSGEFGAEFFAAAFDSADPDGVKNFQDLGKEITTMSSEELDKWNTTAKTIWTKWVEDNKDKMDSQKAVDQITEIIAQVKQN